MKTNFLKTILPITLMILFAGCTGIRVSTDFDRKADFAKYKTFNFSKEVDALLPILINRGCFVTCPNKAKISHDSP